MGMVKKCIKDIEVSENGIVYVLGISLGTCIEDAKKMLLKYNGVEENNNSLYLSCSMLGFKNIRISYIKDENDHIVSIKINYSQDSFDRIESLFDKIDDCFKLFDKSDEKKLSNTGNVVTYKRTNRLQCISFLKQKDPSINALSILIRSDLFNLSNLNLLQQSVYGVFTSKEKNMTDNINKMKSNNIWGIIKVILICFALLIAYLFALNGRYHFNDEVVFDKWNKTIGYIDYGSDYVDFP